MMGHAYRRYALCLRRPVRYPHSVDKDLCVEKVSHPYVVEGAVRQNVVYIRIVAVPHAVLRISLAEICHDLRIQSAVGKSVCFNYCHNSLLLFKFYFPSRALISFSPYSFAPAIGGSLVLNPYF